MSHWCFLLLAVLSLAASLRARAWEIHSIGGRDYVATSEVAAFYGLSDAASPDAETRAFSGSQRSLRVNRDTRAIAINGIVHWLAFPVVEKEGRFLISRLDLGKTIEPAFRPEMVEGTTPFTTVVLDAGHGGHDRGALSVFESEKNFTLDVARRVRDALKAAGVKVVMTRNSDVFLELAHRAAIANRTSNSIFVSLHFNAADANPAADGIEIFCVTPRGAPSTAYEILTVRDMVEENGNEADLQSFVLANTIHHALHGRLQATDRGVKRARFAVLRFSKVPSVLIEGGFLTNAADARRIASRQWRDAYAKAIVDGLLEYQRFTATKRPPRQVAQYRSGQEPVATVVTSRPSQAATPKTGGPGLRDLP